MSDYRLTPEAADDLQAIIERIACDNPDAAGSVLDEMTKALETLASMPEIGVRRPLLQERIP